MNPPRLRYFGGTNFGSFPTFKLELPETGLLLLRGLNEDTGGGSGSGKSTLIKALNYPIGMCDVPLTELHTWGCDIDPVISEGIDFDGQLMEVTKGKRYELKVAGETFKGSAGQKDAEMDRLFGMDAEMRRALTYRGQREPGLFLSKTDSEKKEFLTKLLGLDKFEEATEAGKAKIEAFERQESVEIARRADLCARLDQEGALPAVERDRQFVELIEQDIVVCTGEVKQLEATISVQRSTASRGYTEYLAMRQPELDPLKHDLEVLERVVFKQPEPTTEYVQASYMVAECGRRIERLVAEDTEARKVIDQQRRDLNQRIQAFSLRAGAINGFKADRDRLAAQLATLERDVCPTCKREWDSAQAQREKVTEELEAVAERIEECEGIEADLVTLRAALDEVPKFEPNPMIEAMRKAQAQADVTRETQKAEGARELKHIELEKSKAELRAGIATLEREIEASGRRIEARLLEGVEELRSQKDAKRNHMLDLQQELAGAKQILETNRARGIRIAGIQKQIADVEENLSLVQASLRQERDFLHLIGREGFLGAIFDEVLAEISAETNQVLSSIANTRNCTIQFVSESMTKKGTVNKEIVPVVTINGHKASLKFGPSGGMLSAIELAVDLAVGHVISRRSGCCPGWLILDESFDGLGPVEKETCLEILMKYANDRLVIVVDHMTETQGLFTKKVEIRYKDGVSRIV